MKKRWLLILGVIYIIIVLVYCSWKSDMGEKNIGGLSTIQYHMIGTVISVNSNNNTIIVRPHDRTEDLGFKYKKILHYLTEEQVVLEYSKSAALYFNGYNGDISKLQKGDDIFFHCFANEIEKRPIPVNSIELLYVENE